MPTDRIFQIGNGATDAIRSNAITVLRNGNTGIGVINPTHPLSFPASLEKTEAFIPASTVDVGIVQCRQVISSSIQIIQAVLLV